MLRGIMAAFTVGLLIAVALLVYGIEQVIMAAILQALFPGLEDSLAFGFALSAPLVFLIQVVGMFLTLVGLGKCFIMVSRLLR